MDNCTQCLKLGPSFCDTHKSDVPQIVRSSKRQDDVDYLLFFLDFTWLHFLSTSFLRLEASQKFLETMTRIVLSILIMPMTFE